MNDIATNTREVARSFGVTTTTIYRWTKNGMPYIKMANGRRGYRISDIQKWLLNEK